MERTDQGKDKNGKPFPKYSKKSNYSESYKKSLDFKIAGKSASKINLQLSGDMLAAITVLKYAKDSVEIGFEKGSEENARADGNIRGTYGQDAPNPRISRDFLGISEKELSKILKYVKD